MADVKPTDAQRGSEGSKKPYQRPQIVYREPLEAMAAICVPSPPAKADVASCSSGPIAS
jgi:hypothetical protein